MAFVKYPDDGLGNLETPRSTWQTGTPERVPVSKEPVVMKQYPVDIEDVFNGSGGQLSTAAHHLACRGT